LIPALPTALAAEALTSQAATLPWAMAWMLLARPMPRMRLPQARTAARARTVVAALWTLAASLSTGLVAALWTLASRPAGTDSGATTDASSGTDS
jgi:hypothetical protein